MSPRIRKVVTTLEETLVEGGRTLASPTRRAAAIAVIENPYSGRFVEDLTELYEFGEELGGLLGSKAVDMLGVPGSLVESFGKAAAVGAEGELEHAAAILHPKLGISLRRAVEKGAALVPSSKKRIGSGGTFDIPLGHKDAAYVRSHFDGMEVYVSDAPRDNEIAVAIAVTDSGRPHARVGGLVKEDVQGNDGLR